MAVEEMEGKQLRLKKTDMQRVMKLADKKGLSFASFVRMIVLEYLDKQER